MTTANERVTDRARVANDGAHSMTLILQPWTIERLLASGEAVVVEGEGPAGAHAELLVERTCDTVAVWAWAGADVRLLAPDGRVLLDWTGAPVPPPPDPNRT